MVIGVLYPLVARVRALAEVDSVLAGARAGRGALVAVTGEPGIGKTRLAEAAADRSRADPAGAFEVIWTWCPSAAGGAPLRPWSRVVRMLASGHAAFDLAEVIAAAARPVLVVIDDAHQADTSSLRLLTELAPALRAMPAVVLVTARDGDQAWRGRLDERGALLRSGLVITLPPFAEDDVAGLVAGVTGAPPAPDLVRVITERSGGNPFLATELARQLAGQDTSADAVRGAVPDSVRVITRVRLAELAEPARSVIESAAVLGARFRRDVLGQLTGVPAGDVLRLRARPADHLVRVSQPHIVRPDLTPSG